MNKELIEIEKKIWDSAWDSGFDTFKQPLHKTLFYNTHSSIRDSVRNSTRYSLEDQLAWFHIRAFVGRVVSVSNSEKDEK